MSKLSKRSLSEFVKAQAYRECSVCQLPKEIREQFRESRRRRLSVATIVAWLHECGYKKVTEEEFIRHGRGRHPV